MNKSLVGANIQTAIESSTSASAWLRNGKKTHLIGPVKKSVRWTTNNIPKQMCYTWVTVRAGKSPKFRMTSLKIKVHPRTVWTDSQSLDSNDKVLRSGKKELTTGKPPKNGGQQK